MFLLDTVSLSELNKREPDPGLAAWVGGQHAADLFISVLTVGEIEHGIQLLPLSRRRVQLEAWSAEVRTRFEDRVLAVDVAVALTWAALQARLQKSGARMPEVDALIAATAGLRGLTVVTRNVRDFERSGVAVLNPWAPASG